MNTLITRNRFPVVACAALAAAVFIGFAKTFYLRLLFESPPLTRMAYIHGFIASAWIMLHYTQARLVAAHRVDLHRRLGIFAAFVAVLLVAQGVPFAIANAAAGHAPPGRNPLQFMSVSLGTTTMFAAFVSSALALRRHREWHKRLMLLGSLTLLMPAMGRLDTQVMQPLGLPRLVLAFAVTAAFLIWACVDDWRKRGRVHPAYLVGGIVLLVSMWGRRWVGMTDAWMPIAQWLVN